MTLNIDLIHDDCLNVLSDISSNIIDLVLCDLPYGTTQCKWDTVIRLDQLWKQYNRIVKTRSPIVLNASQPFTSLLICSNIKQFKYCWSWNKSKPSTGLFAKKAPLLVMEDIVVFGKGKGNFDVNYYPIMYPKEYRKEVKNDRNGETFGNARITRMHDNKGLGYPKNLINISNANQKDRLHPTQKPLELVRYLIETYSKEGDTVLDNCMGSGTTGVVCKQLGRNFIGIEKEKKYFDAAKDRINATT